MCIVHIFLCIVIGCTGYVNFDFNPCEIVYIHWQMSYFLKINWLYPLNFEPCLLEHCGNPVIGVPSGSLTGNLEPISLGQNMIMNAISIV
jgi:hypothetical protein